MKYNNVHIEAFGYALPEQVVTSDELENWLKPLYDRLNLCNGRIELMSGIRERRFWAQGTLPSQAATLAARNAMQKANISKDDIQVLINCSVSRDFVEPATSTEIHRRLELNDDVINFDISNACLGMASGISMLANMIELGQINCGIATCGENAGPLVKNTVAHLNSDGSITRQSLKNQFASLTIGSCAAAVIVTSAQFSRTRHRLLATSHCTDSSSNNLCQGDANGGMTDNSAPLMQTDSQTLLHKGIATAQIMWNRLKDETGWNEQTPDLFCTHQVGKAHSALLFQTLGLPIEKDFTTFPILGNCGSASWPVTCAMAEEQHRLQSGTNLAVLAIGSGINCDGLAIQY